MKLTLENSNILIDNDFRLNIFKFIFDFNYLFPAVRAEEFLFT